MLKRIITIGIAISLLFIMVACGTGETADEPEQPSGEVALSVTGMVDNELALTQSELEAMDTIQNETTNKEGETESNTGVPVNSLLDDAGVQADATTVVFIGDDGYEAEAALGDIRGCNNCIVAFADDGGLYMSLPGFPGNVQVKGVIEIYLK